MKNYRAWGPFIECYEDTHFDHAFQVSWSQSGEDIAIRDLLSSRDSSRFYIDIGAHHPSRFSVTRHLYQMGWTGLNVDANSKLSGNFSRDRSRDVFLNYAVGTKEQYDFYSGEELAVSTTNLDWKRDFELAGMIYTMRQKVRGIKLRELFDHPTCPKRITFLNIDIEGSDLDALNSGELEQLDHYRWPEWILVESSPPVREATNVASVRYLLSLGYELWLQLPNATLLRSPHNY